ncbi:hypothetical protein EV44_g3842 [Erysiphe necator]|uniref:Uncharacterized protein n=1 Tax=Uncinula necator TaxID=52586 RepID=A0A0B1P810_UNCNE|nr:hypothetical protein EV44_g3842 [Erysiphe necator]
MAPPLVSKRALPSEPPDTGNRVSKQKPTSGRIPQATAAKTHLLLATGDVFGKVVTNEKMLSEEYRSTDLNYDSDDSMESSTDQRASKTPENVPPEEHFPMLSEITQIRKDARTSRASHNSSDDSQNDAAKIQHPGIGADFLALLADGASRAMRGERVYCSVSKPVPTINQSSNDTWAEKAKFQSSGTKILNIKNQTIKASPPQGQSKEDRRVMIRLNPHHEARKSGSFELRQAIQKLVPDSPLVTDGWIVPSDIAALAPTPVEAAVILQAKKATEDRFGNAFVERQEVWTTFFISPINKRIKGLDDFCDPMDCLLQEELAHINQ